LVNGGISPEKIITQACPKLAGSIERGTHSEETRQLVKAYTDSVMNKLQGNETELLISFNCTHYGYVADLFRETFQERAIPIKKELDPNPFMADFIFKPDYLNRYSQPKIIVEVYSQPELPQQRIQSIAPLIGEISPQTATALENYTFVPEFFEWESIAPLSTRE
jgi:glutamate racemase